MTGEKYKDLGDIWDVVSSSNPFLTDKPYWALLLDSFPMFAGWFLWKHCNMHGKIYQNERFTVTDCHQILSYLHHLCKPCPSKDISSLTAMFCQFCHSLNIAMFCQCLLRNVCPHQGSGILLGPSISDGLINKNDALVWDVITSEVLHQEKTVKYQRNKDGMSLLDYYNPQYIG